MSIIKINPSGVKNAVTKIKIEKVIKVKSEIQSTKSRLDPRILNRNGIGSNLQSSISQANTIEVRLSKLEKMLQDGAEKYSNTEKKIVSDANKDKQEGIKWPEFQETAAALATDKLLKIKNLRFKLFKNKEDGKIYLKARSKIFSRSISLNGFKVKLTKLEESYQENRKLIQEQLGAKNKMDTTMHKPLFGDGLVLYDTEHGKYKSNTNKFENTKFKALNDAVLNLGKDPVKVAKSTLKSEFWENFNIFKDFSWKGWKNAVDVERVGKAAGAAATLWTFYGNGKEHFRDSKTGEWSVNGQKIMDFSVDTGVDIASGAGSMAIGAGIGSLILPPAGTVVGAVVGLGINVFINSEWNGSGKSLVDYTKDGISKGIDKAIDKGKGFIKKIFW